MGDRIMGEKGRGLQVSTVGVPIEEREVEKDR